MIRAVIFDADGMLTHGPRFSDTYASEHGISVDVITPFFTGPFKQCLIGKADLKQELKKGWLEKWQWTGTVDELLKYWFSVGDVLDTKVLDSARELKKRGVYCVVATNQERYRTDYLVNTFSFNDVFDKVFSSAYVGCKKPSAEFFEYICNFLHDTKNIEKDEILFWDDDPENVAGAQECGLDVRQYVTTDQYMLEMRKLGLLP